MNMFVKSLYHSFSISGFPGLKLCLQFLFLFIQAKMWANYIIYWFRHQFQPFTKGGRTREESPKMGRHVARACGMFQEIELINYHQKCIQKLTNLIPGISAIVPAFSAIFPVISAIVSDTCGAKKTNFLWQLLKIHNKL